MFERMGPHFWSVPQAANSCWRISDLLLWMWGRISVLSDSSAIFQLTFGLNQYCPGHAFPPIRCSVAPDESLCPVYHALRYHATTADICLSSVFSDTTVPPHKVSVCITLHQWFAHILKEAGVVASLGSSCSAVASFSLSQGLGLKA